MDRNECKECAYDTLEIIKYGRYMLNGKNFNLVPSIRKMLERTKLYRNEDIYINKEKFKDNAIIKFKNKTTIESALSNIERYNKKLNYKVGILNFASAKHPGGGFLKGSIAQEESIARVSSLYESLLKFPEFYNHNLDSKTALYTNYIIYSESVSIIKNDEGKLLNDYYNVDIITSPAVNAGVIKKNEPHNIPKIYSTMKQRIRKILKVAADNNIDCLVLGAFGCGVFDNNLKDIAQIFKSILYDEDYIKYFKVIEFAIYDKNPNQVEMFKKYFN